MPSTNIDQKSPQINDQMVISLISQTLQECSYIDSQIVPQLASNWRLERLHSMIRAILRVAVAELAFFGNIPAKVIINEYTSLARMFAENQEISFVNGILDKIATDLRKEEMGAE